MNMVEDLKLNILALMDKYGLFEVAASNKRLEKLSKIELEQITTYTELNSITRYILSNDSLLFRTKYGRDRKNNGKEMMKHLRDFERELLPIIDQVTKELMS